MTQTSPPNEPSFEINVYPRLSEIDRAVWDGLANPSGQPYDPFLSWDFLQALEEAGCATPGTGWSGRHLVCKDPSGQIVGVVPAWLKSHSQGEYIFDHAFADAWHRAGGRWYPKLLSSVPFTPVPGRRLLVGDGPNSDAARAVLLSGLTQIADQAGLQAIQLNFVELDDIAAMTKQGWIIREDRQFHFFNKGYRCFEDFLGKLSSEKRKNLRKERAKAQADNEILRLSGRDITDEHWDVFFECYMDTGDRKWGTPYLNRRFFSLIHERMADKVVLILARDSTGWIASALNFVGSDALYGRHWGRLQDRPFLHFELCYYQAIDEAIARGLKRVEAGAQGGHKLARGYVPVSTFQGTRIADPGLRHAIADYVKRERQALKEDDFWLQQRAPFRHGDHSADGQ
jgi:uncharacterized protein